MEDFVSEVDGRMSMETMGARGRNGHLWNEGGHAMNDVEDKTVWHLCNGRIIVEWRGFHGMNLWDEEWILHGMRNGSFMG